MSSWTEQEREREVLTFGDCSGECCLSVINVSNSSNVNIGLVAYIIFNEPLRQYRYGCKK